MRRSVLVSLLGVLVVLSMTLGLIMGRWVLAEDGKVAAVTVRTAGAQEAVKIVA